MKDETKLAINLSPKSLSILIDTIRNLRTVKRHICVVRVEDDEDEHIDQTDAMDILFLNKVGQDAVVKLHFRNKGLVRVGIKW